MQMATIYCSVSIARDYSKYSVLPWAQELCAPTSKVKNAQHDIDLVLLSVSETEAEVPAALMHRPLRHSEVIGSVGSSKTTISSRTYIGNRPSCTLHAEAAKFLELEQIC